MKTEPPPYLSIRLSASGVRLFLALLLLIGGRLCAAEALAQSAGKHPGFVGTQSCTGCHEQEHSQWQGSHHDLAMQSPTRDTVLGDFDDAVFEYFGRETRFYTRGERFFVETDGPDGTAVEYEVAWVFGVYPLQQYLLPMADGRLQALSIAWDSRAADDGGQRWYHLYPEEDIRAGDPLHWTGPYQNWNTRCAECHSTDLQKNYDYRTRRFATAFFEEDVGCEGCHGPGEQHLALARAGTVDQAPAGGFATQLGARGEWYFPEGEAIARRREPLDNRLQIDSCGRCHARRSTLGPYEYGQPLSDTHRLSLLGQPLYHHDGQILDEVYVYGSFVQSKMHQAGVVCSNCHEPHSNQLRAPGNGVCAQCHKPAVFDSPDHHQHPAQSAGAQCVNCHMPATTYMGVDARRDHSMRIPRPDLSVMLGTPNACNACHSDESAQWALDALRERGTPLRNTAAHPAVAMADLQRGDARAVPTLLEIAADPAAPPIWRATALERAAPSGSRESQQLVQELLSASDPLLRVAAVRAAQQLPLPQRYARLQPLITDAVAGVRMEVATALAGLPLGELSDSQRRELLGLFDEYKSVQNHHRDMPSINMQLGIFNATRGDAPAAESAYREALALNPQLVAGYLNLADLLRGQGREDEAREQLLTALDVNPESGDAMHALGLLEIRTGDTARALDWLQRAAQRETQGSRHRLVYAIALHDLGDARAAIDHLRELHRALPADEQVLLALANYNAEIGERAEAQRYAARLISLAPANPAYQRLAAWLGMDP